MESTVMARAIFKRFGFKSLLALGCFGLAAIYLFATRPAPLQAEQTSGRTVPVETVFRVVAAENDAARKLWTADIVGAGVKAGLKFNEKWREPTMEAGPLPALFLREASAALQKTRIPLGLFLGSDFPISQSNRFSGAQADHFANLRKTGEPEFFNAADIGRFTAIFPDRAVAPGCVTCHNEHPNSPKTDWKLNDIMGATTWSYPKERVTLEELVQIVAALRASFGAAYDAYLTKVATFGKPPEIGDKWPAEGYFIPSKRAFLAEFERRASPNTVERLLLSVAESKTALASPGR
jgi:adenylate cyclase